MKELFGSDHQKNMIYLYTLENDRLILKTTDFGAACVSIIDKKTGIDILRGFDNAKGYIDQNAHIGGSIGRTANRTKNAQFVLNGKTFHITANEGKNNLHGGNEGFDRKMYDTEETDHEVIFTRISRDGEEGYPGDLLVRITYTLEDNTVTIHAEGKALDQDTLFAFTNHNYYNLNNEELVLNHEMKINADYYAENESDGISKNVLKSVEGTPFDFREFKLIGKDLHAEDEQLISNRGYDHHFAIRGNGLREFAVCRGKNLQLTVESDLPGMHVYTANYLNIENGKKGQKYLPYSAVCFEPEYLPNAINYDNVQEKPIVRSGETGSALIRLTVDPIQ